MSSGKLGISADEDNDQDNADMAAADEPATRKLRKPRAPTSVASGPGGWLTAGALGAPVEDGNLDDGEEEGGSGDGKGVGVTIETQTDDDIAAATERGAIEKGGGRKLPPWAKPWTPPAKLEIVPDPIPAGTSAPRGETKKKVRSVVGNSPGVEGSGPCKDLSNLIKRPAGGREVLSISTSVYCISMYGLLCHSSMLSWVT